MMSLNQKELFSRVKTHLLTQNAKSLHPLTHGCVYRGMEGRSCAIGCLISDEVYHLRLEGEALLYENDNQIEAALTTSGVHFDVAGKVLYMLQKLQDVHDLHKPDTWTTKLDDLERELNIT